MPDLTRFDFHVNRFMNSYSVDLMDSSEVGQYLLLLCKAWLMGKDTCLPDDAAFLARHARAQEVSKRVLENFPLVETEWGTMRRNGVLFEEWQAAQQRSETARQRVAGRGGKWAEAAASNTEQNTVVNTTVPNSESDPVTRKSLPTPSRFIAVQTGPVRPEPKSNQINQAAQAPERLDSSHGAAAPYPAQSAEPDFKTFKIIWERKIGNLGRDKNTIGRYNDICTQHGADVVHEVLEKWATDSMVSWLKSRAITYPFFFFIKKFPELVNELYEKDKTHDPEMRQAAALVETLPPAPPIVKESIDDAIRQMEQAEEKARQERAAKFSKVEQESGTVLDYL